MRIIQISLVCLVALLSKEMVTGFMPTDGGKWEYMGCWRDKGTRDIGDRPNMKQTNAMTHEICYDFCKSKNYTYAGLQYKKQCFCDNYFGTYGIKLGGCEWKTKGSNTDRSGASWANAVYKTRSDACDNKQCGEGAKCRIESAQDPEPKCYCPSGAGDADVKCLDAFHSCDKHLSCNCWGDPHCTSFDGKESHFQGACKYDLISTECHKDLPTNLQNFSVRVRHEPWGRLPTHRAVIKYIELNFKGKQYRLYQTKTINGVRWPLAINGLQTDLPFYDSEDKVDVRTIGSNMVLSTQFGLKIVWNAKKNTENPRQTTWLCDSYAGYVCGLCGNGDGNKNNDFVDRENNDVPLDSSQGRFGQYSAWGNAWKVLSDVGDNTTDLDGTRCRNADDPEGEWPEEEECEYEEDYKTKSEWCALMKDTTSNGPWKACITKLDANGIAELTNMIESSCAPELCGFEHESDEQQKYLCGIYETWNDNCMELGVFPDWRVKTNCPKECGDNQEFRKTTANEKCPKTCLDPDAESYCGEQEITEDCFCKNGFVLDNNGECITLNECGCVLNGTIIQPGQVSVSNDCTEKIECLEPQGNPTVTTYPSCEDNEICTKENNEPKCACKDGYVIGANQKCEPEKNLCQESPCYGVGDPHYTTQFGYRFNINNTCSYILGADKCDGSGMYSINMEHQHLNGIKHTYMKTLRVNYNGVDSYSINSNKFYVAGAETDLPFTAGDLQAYNENNNIVVDSPKFNVAFDGKFVSRIRLCSPMTCGLCKLKENTDKVFPFTEYITNEDNTCLQN